MKKASSRLISIILTIVLVTSLAVVAMAASGTPVTKSGIEASLSTDKDSYVTGETIDAVVTVKNNSGKTAEISVATKVPEGLTLAGKANYTATVKNGKTHETSAPARTSDTAILAPSVVLGVVAIGAFVALLMLGKNNRAVMSLLLVLALVGGMGVLAVPAQAASETIELTCPIKLDGKDANVTATVEFTLVEAPVNPPVEEPDDVLFEDDFADLEGWADFPASGLPAGSSITPKNGTMFIDVPKTATGNIGKTHALDNFSGKVTFEVDMTVTYPADAADSKQFGAFFVNTDGGASVCFFVYTGKLGYYDPAKTTGKTVNMFADYTSGTTLKLKIAADTATDLYDIYIGGEKVATGVQFRNAGEKFNKLQIQAIGSGYDSTVTFANLKITAGGEIVGDNTTDNDTTGGDTNANVLFEDNFADLEGWADFPAAGLPAGSSITAKNGTMFIDVPKSASGNVGKTHVLDNFSGKVTFEVDMTVTYPADAADSKQFGAFFVNTDGGASVCFFVYTGKLGFYDPAKTTGKTVNMFADYTSGTTLKLKIAADTATDLYDIYIGGEKVATGVQFRNAGEKFNKLQIQAIGSGYDSTVTFANLKITAAE